MAAFMRSIMMFLRALLNFQRNLPLRQEASEMVTQIQTLSNSVALFRGAHPTSDQEMDEWFEVQRWKLPKLVRWAVWLKLHRLNYRQSELIVRMVYWQHKYDQTSKDRNLLGLLSSPRDPFWGQLYQGCWQALAVAQQHYFDELCWRMSEEQRNTIYAYVEVHATFKPWLVRLAGELRCVLDDELASTYLQHFMAVRKGLTSPVDEFYNVRSAHAAMTNHYTSLLMGRRVSYGHQFMENRIRDCLVRANDRLNGRDG